MGGGVQIGDVDAGKLRGGENGLEGWNGQSEDGGHGPSRGAAHEQTALFDEFQAGDKIEHIRREQRVVFAQAVAGHKIGPEAGVLDLLEKGERIDDVESRLGELGLIQLLPGVLEAKLADGIAQDLVRLFHFGGEQLEQTGAHADLLGALTWKHINARHGRNSVRERAGAQVWKRRQNFAAGIKFSRSSASVPNRSRRS